MSSDTYRTRHSNPTRVSDEQRPRAKRGLFALHSRAVLAAHSRLTTEPLRRDNFDSCTPTDVQGPRSSLALLGCTSAETTCSTVGLTRSASTERS